MEDITLTQSKIGKRCSSIEESLPSAYNKHDGLSGATEKHRWLVFSILLMMIGPSDEVIRWNY
jgi:hypothetical protein